MHCIIVLLVMKQLNLWTLLVLQRLSVARSFLASGQGHEQSTDTFKKNN